MEMAEDSPQDQEIYEFVIDFEDSPLDLSINIGIKQPVQDETSSDEMGCSQNISILRIIDSDGKDLPLTPTEGHFEVPLLNVNSPTSVPLDPNIAGRKIVVDALPLDASKKSSVKPRKRPANPEEWDSNKDQCNICDSYKNSEQSSLHQKEHDEHLALKEAIRLRKNQEKEMAEKGDIVLATFDLQAVLPTPCGQVNAFYYKSKLATYNLTVCDIGKDKKGYCYVWNESEGKRGAIEIGTCVIQFIREVARGKPMILYSDNCVGQNKNKYILSALMYAVREFNVPEITLNFYLVGHGQNEGDNMHSVIEKQKQRTLKSGPIYVPSQWIGVISSAKKTGSPYKINELDYHDFYYLKLLSADIGKNYNKTKEKQSVNWNKIRSLTVKKDQPSSFFYKYDYQEEYNEVVIGPMKTVTLKKAYEERLPISLEKLKGFLDLCQQGHIPTKYHNFYKNLKEESVKKEKKEKKEKK
ncbi:hypothetical protein DMENIID0001_107780 [Sergentomyia squamirostris]